MNIYIIRYTTKYRSVYHKISKYKQIQQSRPFGQTRKVEQVNLAIRAHRPDLPAFYFDLLINPISFERLTITLGTSTFVLMILTFLLSTLTHTQQDIIRYITEY